jgi:endonuclease YncB( thermonuclease family)
VQTTNRYSRTVAQVFRAGDSTPVNQTLLQQGFPVVDGHYLKQWDQASHDAAEAAAAAAKRGIWGSLGQDLVKLWDYRANQRAKHPASSQTIGR